MKGIPSYILISLLVFCFTRLLLFFAFDLPVTDVSLYHDWALKGVIEGKMPYKDFWFPYPPLVLPLIYIPILFYKNFLSYRHLFRMEMFLFDLLVFFLLFRLAKIRFQFTKKRIMASLALYSFLSLTLAHLIYDRLDLVITSIFCATLYLYPLSKRNLIIQYLLAWGGFFIKLVPVFWLPVVILRWAEGNKKVIHLFPWKRLLFFAASFFLPILFLAYGLEIYFDGHYLKQLGAHGERGIQVESLWATPFWVMHLFLPNYKVMGFNFLNSDHIHPDLVPAFYLFLSKYLGFVLLSFFFSFLFFFLFRKRKKESEELMSMKVFFLSGFLVLMILLCTQRVLSPQFFIWVLPGFSILIVWHQRWYFSGSVILCYLLTFMEFGLGYVEFAHKGEPFFVTVVILRNIILVYLLIIVLQLWYRELKFEGRGNAAGRSLSGTEMYACLWTI